jgi:hypothetical protein
LIIPLHQLCVDTVGRKVQMEEEQGGYGGESRVYEMPGATACSAPHVLRPAR